MLRPKPQQIPSELCWIQQLWGSNLLQLRGSNLLQLQVWMCWIVITDQWPWAPFTQSWGIATIRNDGFMWLRTSFPVWLQKPHFYSTALFFWNATVFASTRKISGKEIYVQMCHVPIVCVQHFHLYIILVTWANPAGSNSHLCVWVTNGQVI